MTLDRSRRLLFGAFLVSLVAHLLALFGWGWPRPAPPAAPVALQAVVTARPATLPAASSVPAASAAHRPPAAARPRPVALPVPTPASAPTPAPTVAPAAAATPAAADAVPAAPLPGTAATVPAAVAVPAPAAGVSADGLRQYRIDLAVAARRFRVYPALARSRGWEGVAEVGVTVAAGVPSPSVRLQRSSGHALLDEQALQMLARAVERTPLPDSLRGQSFVVPLPVRFSLEE
ncbi:TonB family protein [Azospira restricta]|uniref:Energy transducer TonB n=1 Tax=Azospira restricta TaxID=404405 RepID=A0A974SS33_9RHOO|nr:TonB family protein [Azospira restricta]QRJ65422.1 energy transducer TonB [Azospira restricta]